MQGDRRAQHHLADEPRAHFLGHVLRDRARLLPALAREEVEPPFDEPVRLEEEIERQDEHADHAEGAAEETGDRADHGAERVRRRRVFALVFQVRSNRKAARSDEGRNQK